MPPTPSQNTSLPISSRGLLGADARPAHSVPALAGRASETPEHPRRSVEDILRHAADFAEPGEMEARMAAEADHPGVAPNFILTVIVLIGALGLLMGGVLTLIAFNMLGRV